MNTASKPQSSARSGLFEELRRRIRGELMLDATSRRLYATDASPYQKLPAGVVFPRDRDDLAAVLRFAHEHRVALIPRGAGTSLAGQCVGDGLVVELARHLRDVVQIDAGARVARVQPGVVLADLNDRLRSHGLRFAPDPSTATRCTLGGMFGNNAWGVHALRDGDTRDHIEALEAVLADGSVIRCGPLEAAPLRAKLAQQGLEGDVYRAVTLAVDSSLEAIRVGYPGMRGIPNNAGYALDLLARSRPWEPAGPHFNLAPFLCGSEGTLAVVSELSLRLSPVPGACSLVCAHFASLDEALRAVAPVLEEQPSAVELLDRHILDLTRANAEQSRNRFWIQGDPQAVLIIELEGDPETLGPRCQRVARVCRDAGLGFAFPRVSGSAVERVWDLRRAGLGLLMGMPGARRAVTGIEDTAVAVGDLPAYVRDVLELTGSLGLDCVVYGSASRGLLHLRPLLDLSEEADRKSYRRVMEGVASAVARYGGSMAAKHGDGRLRAGFIEHILGVDIGAALRDVKLAFDPHNLLNPGKIINAPSLTADLRPAGRAGEVTPVLDWSRSGGLAAAAARCNGAAACLKTAGRGTMCPSYMATREELHVTRGRANLLRQALAAADPAAALAGGELARALDLCLSCKGCKAECPANVDMARLKAEVLQQAHLHNGTPWRTRMLGRFVALSALGSRVPWLANALLASRAVRRLLRFHPERGLPQLAPERFSRWFARPRSRPHGSLGASVALLNDPFTEFYHPEVGIAAVELFESLGYDVVLAECLGAGRIELSQGLLQSAQRTAERTVGVLAQHAARGMPLVGLEPSEVLTLRDEVPDLLQHGVLARQARSVARAACTFEEFVAHEAQAGHIQGNRFQPAGAERLLLHVHCHQKALSTVEACVQALRLIPRVSLEVLPTGCCGMAGAFGYEHEHYDLSRRIGELVLLPAVRQRPANARVVATGASCRQQVLDGAGVRALHPAEVLRSAVMAGGGT